MADERKTPLPYELVDIEEFREKLLNSKKIKVVLKSNQAKAILTRSGYQVSENGEIKNEDGSTILGIDGGIPNLKFGAVMPGSNVFVPRNRSAFYKYFVEHTKA